MKKTVCIVISGVIAFSLAACVPAPKNSMPDSTVNKTTTVESVKIEISETSQTENSELHETITTTTTTSESLPTYEFDALQNIFININENTTK